MRLDDGWFEFESDIWSQVGNEYANINAGETYTVTGSFSLGGTQSVTQSSQLYVHYYDGSTLLGDPVLLVDSSDATSTLDFMVTLLPPPDTDRLKFASTVHVLTGSATYSMSEISRREPGSSTQRSTYYLAGKAIATRINGTTNDDGLYFFHSDHLGSATVMSYGQGHASVGQAVAGSETRYLPFGDWRTEPTVGLTELGYTGHHHDNLQGNDLGLIYMNARFYISGVYRFATADTIVPDPANPQAYNRYSYVYNNPILYNDPSGHCASNDEDCWSYLENVFCQDICSNWNEWIRLTFGPSWKIDDLKLIRESLLATKFALQNVGLTDWKSVMTSFKFFKTDTVAGRSPTEKNAFFAPLSDGTYGIGIFAKLFEASQINVVFGLLHEIGHAIDHKITGNDDLGTWSVLGHMLGDTYSPHGFRAGENCVRSHACNKDSEAWADGFAMFATSKSCPLSFCYAHSMEWLVNNEFIYSQAGNIWSGKHPRFTMSSQDIINVKDSVEFVLTVNFSN